MMATPEDVTENNVIEIPLDRGDGRRLAGMLMDTVSISGPKSVVEHFRRHVELAFEAAILDQFGGLATLHAIRDAYGGNHEDPNWDTPEGIAEIIEELSCLVRVTAASEALERFRGGGYVPDGPEGLPKAPAGGTGQTGKPLDDPRAYLTPYYPRNPTTRAEALQTLAEFARTAPGRLPERVTVALDLAATALREEP